MKCTDWISVNLLHVIQCCIVHYVVSTLVLDMHTAIGDGVEVIMVLNLIKLHELTLTYPEIKYIICICIGFQK